MKFAAIIALCIFVGGWAALPFITDPVLTAYVAVEIALSGLSMIALSAAEWEYTGPE